MDKGILIKRLHYWRRRLSQDIHDSPNPSTRIEEIPKHLCNALISHMLTAKDLPKIPLGLGTSHPLPVIPKGELAQFHEDIGQLHLAEMPFEVLSDVYESFLATKLIPSNSTGKLEDVPENKLRKGKGA